MTGPASISDYHECTQLTNLALAWFGWPGEADIVYEVWYHMASCPLCLRNRQIILEWRMKKAKGYDEVLRSEPVANPVVQD